MKKENTIKKKTMIKINDEIAAEKNCFFKCNCIEIKVYFFFQIKKKQQLAIKFLKRKTDNGEKTNQKF